MTALTSVARLSFSMTMSMSSGLFSMVDEDEVLQQRRPSAARRLSWGGEPATSECCASTSKSSRGGLLARLTRRSGQAGSAAMLPAVPTSILEKYKARCQENNNELAMQERQVRGPSRTPPASPPNSCGIQIVIDGGSATPSSESDDDTANTLDTPDSESYLNVDYTSDSRRSSNSSGSSRTFLLNEIRWGMLDHER